MALGDFTMIILYMYDNFCDYSESLELELFEVHAPLFD